MGGYYALLQNDDWVHDDADSVPPVADFNLSERSAETLIVGDPML